MGKNHSENQDKETYVRNLFAEIAPTYEFINHLLSFNLDRFWRRRAVARFFRKSHRRILDACCGTGELTEILRRKLPAGGSVTGIDFCEDMLKIAAERHRDAANVDYHVGNILCLPFTDESFDAVYNCFALRNVNDISGALTEMCRVIKPGGQLVIIDLTLPRSTLGHWYLTHVVPLIGRLCHGSKNPYMYLSASIRQFYQPAELREQLKKHGLRDVEYIQFLGGIVTAVCGTVGNNKPL